LERKAEVTYFCLFPSQPEQGPFISTFQRGNTSEIGSIWRNIIKDSQILLDKPIELMLSKDTDADKMECFCPLRFLEQCLTHQPYKQQLTPLICLCANSGQP